MIQNTIKLAVEDRSPFIGKFPTLHLMVIEIFYADL